jgi:hypothetical protein
MSRANSPRPDPLLRHLALALGVKLMALVALWWFVVHGQSVAADAQDTAVHFSPNASPHAAQPPLAGASR